MPNAPASNRSHAFWWARDGLGYADGELRLDGRSLARLTEGLDTPLYAYSEARVMTNLGHLRAALDALPVPVRIFYAVKSNRFAPLLTQIRASGLCGADVCSPGEIAMARGVGFAEDALSFTATSLSERDVAVLSRFPDIALNLDSFATMRTLGRLSPGRRIGLRLDPGVGVGYRDADLLQYSGSRVSKFGIELERTEAALAEAARARLTVEGLHMHVGCGYLEPQLARWRQALDRAVPMLDRLDRPRYLNVGGGMGIPLVEDDAPLDLGRWADTVASALRGRDVELWIEPGDMVVKDAGVLLLEVTQVEHKRGRTLVGVNGGFNIHIEPAFYQLPLEIVPVRRPPEDATWRPCTVIGNINEAHDIWALDAALPPLEPGDVLAFLNAGGYGSSMSSNHCLRGTFRECLIPAAPTRVDG